MMFHVVLSQIYLCFMVLNWLRWLRIKTERNFHSIKTFCRWLTASSWKVLIYFNWLQLTLSRFSMLFVSVLIWNCSRKVIEELIPMEWWIWRSLTTTQQNPEGFQLRGKIHSRRKNILNDFNPPLKFNSNIHRKFTESQGKNIKKASPPPISFWKLFRFATRFEIFLVFVGIFCATVASLGLPYGMILYGEFTTILVDREIREGTSTRTNILRIFGGGRVLTNATPSQIYDATMEDSRAFGIGCFCGAIVQLIFAALSIDILNRTATKQISKIRKLFLQSVLRQDMTWYDLNTSDNFAVKMTE